MQAYPDAQPVMQQPAQTVVQHVQVTQVMSNPMLPRGPPREFSSELFGCCDDMTICLCTLFNPCYGCMLATDMDESCCVPCCIPQSLIAMRAVVRSRHNIRGNLMNDCVMMNFCGYCATCQLGREVQNIKNGRAMP